MVLRTSTMQLLHVQGVAVVPLISVWQARCDMISPDAFSQAWFGKEIARSAPTV